MQGSSKALIVVMGWIRRVSSGHSLQPVKQQGGTSSRHAACDPCDLPGKDRRSPNEADNRWNHGPRQLLGADKTIITRCIDWKGSQPRILYDLHPLTHENNPWPSAAALVFLASLRGWCSVHYLAERGFRTPCCIEAQCSSVVTVALRSSGTTMSYIAQVCVIQIFEIHAKALVASTVYLGGAAAAAAGAAADGVRNQHSGS